MVQQTVQTHSDHSSTTGAGEERLPLLDIRGSVDEALTSVANEARNLHKKAVVVVCGTAFIMAEVRAAIGIVEPKDGDLLHQAMNNDGDDSFLDAQEHFVSTDSKSANS
jgi:hypothetical protein